MKTIKGSTKEVLNYIIENDKEANQYRLAKALNVNTGLVNHWVHGKAKIPEKYYLLLKEIYPSIEITDFRKQKYFKLGNLE